MPRGRPKGSKNKQKPKEKKKPEPRYFIPLEYSWDRRPDESHKQYERFVGYLKKKPPRNIKKYAEELGLSFSGVYRTSHEQEWNRRAGEYDSYVARESMELMKERHIEEARYIQDVAMQALRNVSIEDIKPQDIAKLYELGYKLESLRRGVEEVQKIEFESKADTASSKLLKSLLEDNTERKE